MAGIKKSDNNKRWQGCGELEPSYTIGGDVKRAAAGEKGPAVPQNVKTF